MDRIDRYRNKGILVLKEPDEEKEIEFELKYFYELKRKKNRKK